MNADLAGVCLERFRRECRAVGIRQATGLFRQDLRHRWPAMADIDNDRAAGGIDVLPAGRIDDRRAVGLDRDRQVGIERATKDPTGQALGGRCHGLDCSCATAATGLRPERRHVAGK